MEVVRERRLVTNAGLTGRSTHLGGGWYARSFPGSPLKERHDPYDKPYNELSLAETAAAATLGILDAETWEMRMPRRLLGGSSMVVEEEMDRPYAQLTESERLAASELGLTAEVWDEQLACFHDDLWRVPGLTLTDAMFKTTLAAVRQLARRTPTAIDVAEFLLALEKLLTPRQAAAICAVLEDLEGMRESLRFRDAYAPWPFPALIASFLGEPNRFASKDHNQIMLSCWNDKMSGCVWGNAEGEYAERPKDFGLTYQKALANRREANNVRRYAAGPILANLLPDSVLSRNAGLRLPPLPQALVHEILTFADDCGVIPPLSVNWLKCYRNSWITTKFARQHFKGSDDDDSESESSENDDE